MTYVNVLHPLFILGWLHAHERLCRPHGRTKVANSWRSPSLSGCAAIRHTRVYQRNYTTYGDIQMENLKGLRAILVENGLSRWNWMRVRPKMLRGRTTRSVVSPL
jgi:hypothetical protein